MSTASTTTDCPLVMVGRAARLADCSAETVRAWIRRGWLPAQRTADGIHLLDPSDVYRVAELRRTGAIGRVIA